MTSRGSCIANLPWINKGFCFFLKKRELWVLNDGAKASSHKLHKMYSLFCHFPTFPCITREIQSKNKHMPRDGRICVWACSPCLWGTAWHSFMQVSASCSPTKYELHNSFCARLSTGYEAMTSHKVSPWLNRDLLNMFDAWVAHRPM